MKIKAIKLVLAALVSSICLTTIAASEQFPLELDADTSDCGTDLANCVLSGNVVIRQGDTSIKTDKLHSLSETEWELDGNITIEKTGISISASKAKIILIERQLTRVQLIGSPVNFNYLVGAESRASGEAQSISFDLNRRVVTLDGDAKLLDGKNALNGEHIEYDLNKERLKANNQGKGDGRVHLVYEPPAKKSNTTNPSPEIEPKTEE